MDGVKQQLKYVKKDKGSKKGAQLKQQWEAKESVSQLT